MKHEKTIEQQYQVLSELEHIRKRVSIYAGSPVIESRDEFIYDMTANTITLKNVKFIPALIKIISEAIDNVVDEHKRQPDKVTQLKFDIVDNEISIYDNGGIPVVIHKDFDMYVPEIIFGMLRSGSNYSDDEAQSLIGLNGLGIKLVSILSSYFVVETADGLNYFKQEYSNGMSEKSAPVVKPSTKNFTKLTFKPDLDYFNLECIDQDHVDKILRRLLDVGSSNSNLKVYFNGNLLKVKDFSDYIGLYYPEQYAFSKSDNWEVGLASSSGFNQTSLVNSVETYMGGTHVDYCLNQITTKVREFFKKKYKIDVKPSDIKSHLHIFINCNINRPKFSSQTKENMISLVADYNTTWDCDAKFIKKVLELDAIQNILDWVKAKEQANINAELRKHSKAITKNDPKNVPKFHDATSKNRAETSLLIVEGDCLEEHTGIIVRTDDGFISKQIKDVKVGDEVVTHLGNIKPVTNKQHRLKSVATIRTQIGDIKCSNEHRMFVYDTSDKTFQFITANQINPKIHKLVKGKFMDYDYVQKIDEILDISSDNSIYSLEFRFSIDGEQRFIKSTLSHKFSCLDIINGRFVFIEAKDIIINQHLFLCNYV